MQAAIGFADWRLIPTSALSNTAEFRQTLSVEIKRLGIIPHSFSEGD